MKTAAEIFKSAPTLKLKIFGDSGSGKTTWSALAPTPFHILTEPQGLESIAAANPDSMVLMTTDYLQIRNTIDSIKRGAPSKLGKQLAYSWDQDGERVTAQTLVIDSLTEVQELALEHYTQRGLKGFEIWGQVLKDMKALLSDLRSLPVNVICISLMQTVTDSDGNAIAFQPALAGKTKAIAPRYFSGVGVAMKRTGKRGTKYQIVWEAGERYITKRPPAPSGVDFPAITTGTLGSILALLYPDSNTARTPRDAADKAA